MTWEDARYIYDTGRELGLTHSKCANGFLCLCMLLLRHVIATTVAGSSVPCCFWRDPWLEHPLNCPLEESLVLSYGDLEAYGYHGLEALQVGEASSGTGRQAGR